MREPGDIFTRQPDDQIARLALIEAIRANTDAVDRLGRGAEARDIKLDHIGEALAKISERLTVIENNSIERDLERLAQKLRAHDLRLNTMEAEEHRREARTGMLAMIVRSPGTGWLVVAAGGVWAFFTGRFQV